MNGGDGTASDIEVEMDASGVVVGFVTSGLDFRQVHTDGTDGCPTTQVGETLAGCPGIKGRLTKYSADLTTKTWEQRFNNFPGGKYQYAGLTATSEALIFTECFGLAKVHDSANIHVGYLASCGQGIEGCDAPVSQVI